MEGRNERLDAVTRRRLGCSNTYIMLLMHTQYGVAIDEEGPILRVHAQRPQTASSLANPEPDTFQWYVAHLCIRRQRSHCDPVVAGTCHASICGSYLLSFETDSEERWRLVGNATMVL